MMKAFNKSKHICLAIFSLVLPCCGIASCTKAKEQESASSVFNDISNMAYYQDISNDLKGTQLLGKLHDLITTTHTKYTSYDESGKEEKQLKTDQAFDENDNPIEGQIIEFYSGVAWPGKWNPYAGQEGGYNREHVWPQSCSIYAAGEHLWGTVGGGADMHHIRPSECRINSTRNNFPYGEIKNDSSRDKYLKYATLGDKTTGLKYPAGYLNNSVFEPLDSKKGDVARILLYVYIHYNSYQVSELFENYATTNGQGNDKYFAPSLLSLTEIVDCNDEQSAINLLLKWNKNDPVDFSEKNRNEQVFLIQGNRNPFIDCPNFANLIWDHN